jgi:hypothetical protein
MISISGMEKLLGSEAKQNHLDYTSLFTSMYIYLSDIYQHKLNIRIKITSGPC